MGWGEPELILLLIALARENSDALPYIFVVFHDKGKGPATKSKEFSEKCQRGGGGAFSIQKFILQILDLYIGLFLTFSEKNAM